ncbi:MAG: YafY family protein [Pseudomonadota bacterium]
MPRSDRMLLLIDALRGRRRPVPGKDLADELGISLRTLYRDIAGLKAQGVPIDGAPGFGYILQPGFLLPPVTLCEDEVDALMLGARMVAELAGGDLARASDQLIGKVLAVLPEKTRAQAELTGLFFSDESRDERHGSTTLLRKAIRYEREAHFLYQPLGGLKAERRHIKPIAIGFFRAALLLAGWCHKRGDFRHFRIDRMSEISVSEERYRPPRRLLLAEWKRLNQIAD